jgi:hypothetical protein
VMEDCQTLECQLAEGVLRLVGKLCLRVSGSNMLPAVWPGNVLSMCRRSATQALPGDIIWFALQGRLFSHRAVDSTIHQGAPYWITGAVGSTITIRSFPPTNSWAALLPFKAAIVA